MPWTFAHPAAVLPLRPLKRLSFGALVIGSLAPDIGYYLGRFDLAAFAHTPLGILTLCLPTGLALITLVRALHRPVANLLPGPHRQALLSLPLMPRLTSPRVTRDVSIAIIIGATTHVAWDSFTHGTGHLVAALPILQVQVFVLSTRSFPLFEILQHASTALGVGLLLAAYARWLRNVDPDSGAPGPHTDRWRYGLLGALAVIALATALPVAYFVSTAKSGNTNLALFVVRYVISCTTVFAVTLSAASLWVARQQPLTLGQGAQPSNVPNPPSPPSAGSSDNNYRQL
jgi:hypothetical protein